MGSQSGVVSSYSYIAELPGLEDIEPLMHTAVLVARSRVDQGRIRAVVEEIFAAYPALGTVFEPFFDCWAARPGGGWGWAVEPPGVTDVDVIARQRASFDMRTGRLFAVSLLPGAPERVVLSASHLCMDAPSWQCVVEQLLRACPALVPA
ncbi:hypothetical protein LAUMK191_01118 [Mycobacterium attenuatum]|uniref:Condensation domain-containing protein n=2 Tax=Mycobacterium attenuatum TaxID=2341086 RepID=A0A498PU91_9MYCO|nr:hypothetical protein [Mycobacterium attenuatum]VBA35653.1 hypothetical protein LAUMK136_01119 [Mycobacterium attenuatum]VBA48237.1 hypothetical protein LAUMK191_01118 [Mycobacterium attenuatum]VBA52564.1 hypothetical protein LAUMK41_01208 [Mycobacterium attenuatum]